MTYRLYSHYRQRRGTDKDIMGESQQVQVNMTASVGLHIIAVYASPLPEASGVRGKANQKTNPKDARNPTIEERLVMLVVDLTGAFKHRSC